MYYLLYLCSGNERGGPKRFPQFYKIIIIMNKQDIQNILDEKLKDTGYELITLTINTQNEILVEIDHLEGVDVEYCVGLNRYMVECLEAQGVDDYSLEVGSVSLTAPFVAKMQYQKHLGHDVEVLAADGKKYRGALVSVDENTFAIDTEVMVAVEGKKRKQKEIQTLTFAYDAVKYTKYDLKF